ncbi:probable maltase isoform X2 [Cryptotermes secundus]|uniref:probable maltase isoform X2 n=1 Tax=Cryptotermes secundus TaxID=105785 RepID=UPI001454E399|nr:probable maltase isoform X2 [Cryptotermes secundus]
MSAGGYVAAEVPYTGLTKDQLLEYPLEWWQISPIYQVYPLSYQDSSHPPDGVGDIPGIESRLDYIKDLGVGAIWLSPIYKSPMKDSGYDIQDFRDIAPVFGTMDDFHSLSKAVHKRGIKLVLDFVPNHSSNLHEWFQKSVKREVPYADYYIWADAKGFGTEATPIPPNNWRSVFGGSAWEWNQERRQFYLHQFLKEQPDLNYRNPLVLEEMKNVMQFWLDQGVDGFRLDAVAHLFEDEDLRDEMVKDEDATDEYSQLDHKYTFNLPEVLDVLREFRIVLDKNSENATKIMMTEAYMPVEKLMAYYGNKSHPIAHFPLNFALISASQKNITAQSIYTAVSTWMNNLPKGAWPNWVIGNHDNSRAATRFGAELVDAINMIALLLPGTPVTYNGEEIGMEDADVSWEQTKDTAGINAGPKKYKQFSRDPERTPMQWDAGINAGFSNANQTWLPVNTNYKTLNVESQLNEKWSHIKVYKQLTEARKTEAIMNGGLDIHILEDSVLVYTRVREGFPGYVVVVNFAPDTVTVDITNLAHMPNESSVYTFSTTYAHSFTAKKRISNSAVVLPGKGGLVLTFVPDFPKEVISL